MKLSPLPLKTGVLALILLTVAVYWPVYRFDFLGIDDRQHIEFNRALYPTTAAGIRFFWTKEYAEVYTPLTYMVWGAVANLAYLAPEKRNPLKMLPIVRIDRFDPMHFHVTNLLFHILNTVLVFFVLNALVPSPWACFFGALLYSFHPLQVETVSWITGLRDLLAASLMYASMLCFFRYWNKSQKISTALPLKWNSSSGPWYLGACALYIVSTLAKSSSLMEPFFLAVFGMFWWRRPFKKLALELLPLFLIFFPLLYTYSLLNASHLSSVYKPDFLGRILVAFDALGFYVQKFFWPGAQVMDYTRTPQVVLREHWFIWTGVTAVAFLSLGVWLSSKPSWHKYFTCFCLFVLGLLPILGLNPFIFQHISTVADRYVYLALLGPALLVSWLLSSRLTKPAWVYSLAFVILAFGIKAGIQVRYWENDETLFSHTFKFSPRSYLSANNLANYLERRGRNEEALKLYETAAQMSDHMVAWANVGAVSYKLGHNERALAAYSRAFEMSEQSAWAHNNLALVYARIGKYNQAKAHLKEASRLEPDYPTYLSNLKKFTESKGTADLELVRENI